MYLIDLFLSNDFLNISIPSGPILLFDTSRYSKVLLSAIFSKRGYASCLSLPLSTPEITSFWSVGISSKCATLSPIPASFELKQPDSEIEANLLSELNIERIILADPISNLI